MLLKKKKSLITSLVVIIAAALLCVGAITLTQSANKAYAYSTSTCAHNFVAGDNGVICSDCGEKAVVAISDNNSAGDDITYYPKDKFVEAWTAANNAGTATITMLADTEINETLVVESGKNITLDLNNTQLKYTGERGSVIQVYGTFTAKSTHEGSDIHHTIKDPQTKEDVDIAGALITGGKGTQVGNSKLGGGVYVYAGATFTIDRVKIAGNTADCGGGVYVDEGANLTMITTSSMVNHNKASKDGGGIYACNANAVVISGEISYNSALAGGGIYFEGGASQYTMGTVYIRYNSATAVNGDDHSGYGGGVYLNDCDMLFSSPRTFSPASINNNNADKQGGGIFVNEKSKLDIGGFIEVVGNKSDTKENNIYLSGDTKINVVQQITDVYDICVNNTGAVITGFTSDKKPNQRVKLSDIFQADDEANNCVWYSNETTGEIYIGHTGEATCTAKAVCDICGKEYGEPLGHKFENGVVCTVCNKQFVALLTIGETNTYYETFAEAWTAANNATQAAKITMYADATVSQTLVVNSGANITLDLHDCVLAFAGTSGSVIRVEGAFTLTHAPGSEIEWTEHSILDPVTGGYKTVEGGVITGGKGTQVGSSKYGGGVYVATGGNFTMNNGHIAGNTAEYGGGVYVAEDATLTMQLVSEIFYNKATEYGGGLYVSSDANVTIGALSQISYNAAMSGGGIFIEGGSVGLSGGLFYAKISENTAENNGGGVYIDGGTFSMPGGTIEKNTATGNGGGVYIMNGAFNMSGGTIENNTATFGNGGGVFNASNTNAVFKLSGAPKISGNENSSDAVEAATADNVFLAGSKTITVAGTLTDGAQIYIYDTGAVATGYTQSDKPSAFFKPDNTANNCVYVDKTAEVAGTVNIGTHTPDQNGLCTACNKQFAALLTIGGSDTYCETFSEAWEEATSATQALTIKMFADASTDKELMLNTKNVTLDLNGKTLTGASGKTVIRITNGSVIKENSVFTLKDSGYGGKITGGALGVSVSSSIFNMEGGSISGNISQVAGGGVFVATNSTFNMSGGFITNNIAARGGGVHIAMGTFNMSGGEISHNTATANDGGGVSLYSGTFNVQGSVSIYYNTKDGNLNNVYLMNGGHINVSGTISTLTTIYMHNVGAVAEGFTEANNPYDRKASNVFFSDDSANGCVWISDKATGTVHIGHTGGTATCTQKAVCKNCNEEYGELAPHDFENGEYIKSNAEHWKKCKNCAAQDTDHKERHSGGTATCITVALCEKCGFNYGGLGDHDFAAEFTVDTPATCTAKGSKSKHCAHCDAKTEVTEIDMIAHTFGEWETVTAATCTTVGSKKHACTVCGDRAEEGIAALGHVEVVDGAVLPTCTEKGKTEGSHCSRCDAVLTAQEEIAALGHDLTHIEAKPATCTEAGWDAYDTCSRCDHSTKAELPALGHDYESEFTIDSQPTTTENGSKSKHCTRCDDKTEVTEIPMLSVPDEPAAVEADGEDGSNNLLWMLLTISLAVIIAGEIVFIAYRRMKRRRK